MKNGMGCVWGFTWNEGVKEGHVEKGRREGDGFLEVGRGFLERKEIKSNQIKTNSIQS